MRPRSRSRLTLVAAVTVLTASVAGCDPRQQPVDAEFAFTKEALMELVQPYPESVRTAVSDSPARFLSLIAEVLDAPHDQWVLVDKSHALASDYIPANLVDLDSLGDRLTRSRDGHRLTRVTTDALLAMSDAARGDGITLMVSSAYRSYAYQKDVYARWVNELGQEEADRVSARPGTSQHQLGTTMDFGCICEEFADQAAGQWLFAHAKEYGFSLSYPREYEDVTGYAYEPWHYRYVGVPAAALQHDYFAGIQQWMLEFLNENQRTLEEARNDD